MSETRNEIDKMTIHGELNLLFTLSKMIVTILDMASDSEIACDTLRSVAETMLNQAAFLYGRVSAYADDLHGSG